MDAPHHGRSVPLATGRPRVTRWINHLSELTVKISCRHGANSCLINPAKTAAEQRDKKLKAGHDCPGLLVDELIGEGFPYGSHQGMEKKEISGDAFFGASQGSRATQLPAYQLTPIEQALLHALSTGASNKQIAKTMLKSEQTVRNQLSTLFKKIHATNRTQAACWYRERVDIRLSDVGTSVLLPARLLSANNASLIDADMRHQRRPKEGL